MLAEILSRKAAVVAAVVFWTALFVFAAMYPGYSHLHRAVSGLGAFGAPHAQRLPTFRGSRSGLPLRSISVGSL